MDSRLLCPWDFPSKNTGVGCHFLLLGIFLTQGLNLGLLYCRRILFTEPPCMLRCFSHVQLCDPMDCSLPGSSVHGILQAGILEWVAVPSSRDLLYPGTKPASLTFLVLAGSFFTTNTTWEAYLCEYLYLYQGFPGGPGSKESACNAGDPVLISGSGRSPGEENGHPLQCSCLENSMDRGAVISL